MTDPLPLEFHPVTPQRRADLERFSQAHGKFRYCSCMRWRLTSGEMSRSTKADRIDALDRLVEDRIPIGVLAYLGDEAVGWCSVAPRETYLGLERYKALARVDDAPVWSIVCFFVDRRVRRTGATAGLIRAATAYAVTQGARIVEGYPVEPGAKLYTYMGSPAAFSAAGFVDVTPDGRDRRVMRNVANCDGLIEPDMN